MIKRVLFFLLIAMSFSFVSAQGVYKWKDANGKVHYGDNQLAPEARSVDTRSSMQGTVAPTAAQKNRADGYLSGDVGGSSGIAAPKPKSRCPYAK